MTYQEFAPPPALRPWVDRLWVLETGEREEAVDPILPDGHPEIILHCAEPFGELDDAGAVRIQAKALFAGQLNHAVRVVPRGHARVLGARLHAYAGPAFVAGPQHPLADRVTDLHALHPPLADALASGRSADGPLQDEVTRFADVLGAFAGPLTEPAVERAVTCALRASGMVSVDAMASAAHVGERHLERLFRHHVGVTPLKPRGSTPDRRGRGKAKGGWTGRRRPAPRRRGCRAGPRWLRRPRAGATAARSKRRRRRSGSAGCPTDTPTRRRRPQAPRPLWRGAPWRSHAEVGARACA